MHNQKNPHMEACIRPLCSYQEEEGVEINAMDPRSMLNSRAEWRQPKVARVILARTLPQGPDLPVPATPAAGTVPTPPPPTPPPCTWVWTITTTKSSCRQCDYKAAQDPKAQGSPTLGSNTTSTMDQMGSTTAPSE